LICRAQWGPENLNSLIAALGFNRPQGGLTAGLAQAAHRRNYRSVRILGLSEIVVVVDCLVACSLQIWGVMEAIGEI
jgi:hypothetical protein